MLLLFFLIEYAEVATSGAQPKREARRQSFSGMFPLTDIQTESKGYLVSAIA